MGCYNCSKYDRGLKRCTLGRINPKTVKSAIVAARTMGSMSYICNEDGMQEKVLDKLTKNKK